MIEMLPDMPEGETLQDVYASDDGTYNPETNQFMCDECYIAAGMPARSTLPGWKVGDPT